MKRIFSTQNPFTNGKSFFLGAIILVMSFGCSIDQETTLVDPTINQTEKSLHSEMAKFLQSPEYKKVQEAIFSSPNSKIQGMGNGAFVIQSEYGQYYGLYQDVDDDGEADLEYFFGVPAGVFTQKNLPNGKVQISVNSNKAEVFVNKFAGYEDWGWILWPVFDPFYSNICEGGNGSLFAKVTGTVVPIEIWPGFIVYILEAGTSDILNLKATVKDSYKGSMVDEETWEETLICEEATSTKSLGIKIISVQQNKNPKFEVNIKFD